MTVPKARHNWDGGRQTSPPSCTGTGTRTYTCTVCGRTRSESIPAYGHSRDGGRVTSSPGCTSTGTRTYYCSRCGIVMGTESIPATGHHWVANSYSGGTIASWRCTNCGKIQGS